MTETPETPEPAPPPDPGASAPRAPTNIDALHDLKAREGTQVATELALRQLLHLLDPHPNDHALTYAEVLGRLQAEDILNWRTIQRGGATILSLIVCREVVEDVQGAWGTPEYFGGKPRTQYRVLRLNELGLYEVSLWTEDPTARGQVPAAVVLQQPWLPTREGQPQSG